LTARELSPDETISVAKSPTSRLARTDSSLLGLQSSRPINVIVTLDYDSIATYTGGVENLRPTSPRVTGRSLEANPNAVSEYLDFVRDFEADVTDSISSTVPQARAITSFRIAYGGLAQRVPANRADDLLQIDGVVAVQRDGLNQPLTDATPEYIGATKAWGSLGGQTHAGEGVKVGVLDTGIWPEHPSFRDKGIDSPGGSYGCEFGDGSDPALGKEFECNDKLLGAYSFVDTYMEFIGAEEGEFCNNETGECSARDAIGHGTHTASTAAGNGLSSAKIFGIERGPLSGVAPGANVIAYRVCLDQGCFDSDALSAVEQAILDDVDVVNYSISGGADAFSDPVELAFLDTYSTGALVNASAGNDGPGSATANHAGPWTNTVGASTSNRHFFTTLHLDASNGDTFSARGVTITPGISESTPVIHARDIQGYEDPWCTQEMEPGMAEGKVVVCEFGVIGRLQKSFNVDQGGAAGMILSSFDNVALATDNHWLPAVMLNGPQPSGDLIEFLENHSGVEATWKTGEPTQIRADVMAPSSSRGPSRGPRADFIKPDVTAPGVQILAGNTPEPFNVADGPSGELFQVMNGTSMSSPHAAGVAALVKAAHRDWTPGQIKSALMTSSVQGVLKEDGETPADPFDRGAGSIRADRALDPVLTFDVSADNYFAAAGDPDGRIHLNLPSIDAPEMLGSVTTERTARNVSGKMQTFSVRTSAPEDASIKVSPSRFTVRPGEKVELEITINGELLTNGQYFGQIKLVSQGQRNPDVVMPVAFNKTEGEIALTHSCLPRRIAVGDSTECQVGATNFSSETASADLEVSGPRGVRISDPSQPVQELPNGFRWSGTLEGTQPPTIDAIEPGGSLFGYVSLAELGFTPIDGIGDESIINFGVPAYQFGGESYDTIGMTSNGYAVVGGGIPPDLQSEPQNIPDPASPNNVLAPFWTDLDPEAGGNLYGAFFSDNDNGRFWIVLEWEDVAVHSTPTETQTFQIWIEFTPGTESISYAYDTVEGSGDPVGLVVGAENRAGTSAVQLGEVPASGEDYSILTSPPERGAVTITYTATGITKGSHRIPARLTSDIQSGTTTEFAGLTVE
jgi:subtilisin family serine protease